MRDAIEAAHARLAADFPPVAGHAFVADPHVQTTISGREIVHLQQQVGGLPIFGGDVVVHVKTGEVMKVAGEVVRVAAEGDGTPDLSAADAVTAAFGHFHKGSDRSACIVPHRSLRGATPRLSTLASFPFPSRPTVFQAGGSRSAPAAHLAYWLDDGKPRLVWVVRLPFRQRSYLLLVAAEGERRGNVVLCTRWSAGAQCFGTVFRFDHTAGPVRVRFPLAAGDLPPLLPHANSQFLRDWVDVDRTAGNSVLTFDGGTEKLLQATMAGGVLEFPAAPPASKEQMLLNAFFYCNFLHDFFLLLGFGETEGNFQLTNFSGHKGGNDRLQVRIFDGKDPHLADMDALDDGKAAKLSLSRAPSGEPTALHAEVVIHEYTHGVVHRMVGGRLATAWLIQQQSQAMDEGWADYFAITLRNHYLGNAPDYRFADWAGIQARSDTYAPSVQRDYGNLGKKPNHTVNGAGEIFAAALIRFNELLGDKLGDVGRGHCIGWRAVIESLRLIGPNPQFLQGRDVLLEAIGEMETAGVVDAAEAAAARDAARKGFARYGMGKNATSKNSAFGGTTSDFNA